MMNSTIESPGSCSPAASWAVVNFAWSAERRSSTTGVRGGTSPGGMSPGSMAASGRT